MYCHRCFFFFSSRRRHTRYWRDWSSDVCSSDLGARRSAPAGSVTAPMKVTWTYTDEAPALATHSFQIGRASCRERVEISVVAVSLKKKKRTAEQGRLND